MSITLKLASKAALRATDEQYLHRELFPKAAYPVVRVAGIPMEDSVASTVPSHYLTSIDVEVVA